MQEAALRLATAMLVVASAACGRSDLDRGPAKLAGDASLRDAARDSSRRDVEAGVADSFVAPDQGTDAADASPDASRPADAAGAPDARSDANHDASPDAADAADATADARPDAKREASTADAGEPHLACDMCSRGSQECGPGQEICTVDAGTVTCAWPGITTCVEGDAGCAVWGPPVACRPDVPCCVPCEHEYDCPLGAIGNPCAQDTDCAFNACDVRTHQCINEQCGDGRQDGEETDVDCGGGYCGPCRTGQGCQSNFDCLGGDYCAPSHMCE